MDDSRRETLRLSRSREQRPTRETPWGVRQRHHQRSSSMLPATRRSILEQELAAASPATHAPPLPSGRPPARSRRSPSTVVRRSGDIASFPMGSTRSSARRFPADASLASGDRRAALPRTRYRQDTRRIDLRQARRRWTIRSRRDHRAAEARIGTHHIHDPRSRSQLRSRTGAASPLHERCQISAFVADDIPTSSAVASEAND